MSRSKQRIQPRKRRRAPESVSTEAGIAAEPAALADRDRDRHVARATTAARRLGHGSRRQAATPPHTPAT
jgi:hypothetical protein